MKTVGIIPARYKSTRFPGKPLALIAGTPMIVHVANITSEALGPQNTYVATDDERIAETCRQHELQYIMTSEQALTGTDRVWEAAQHINADIYVNIQGDEPFLNPKDICDIVQAKKLAPNAIINACCPINPDTDPSNPNIPKVVINEQRELVYMSRAPIPGSKAANPNISFLKQVCIYAFNISELNAFGEFGRKSKLESIEDIEILRFFELNRPIQMHTVSSSSLAVDTPEDLKKAESYAAQK